ncbi:MAG TPA: hypothetical protein EYO33_08925 [Phycisphaerales bacterium]|nr:hypothetical protein [Phycisphaerales bacterium]
MILLFALLTGSASADVPVADEFCGGGQPPLRVIKQMRECRLTAGHSCCSETVCRCSSLICGGAETSWRTSEQMLSPQLERLLSTFSSKRSGRRNAGISYHALVSHLTPRLPDAPLPPPPER